MCACVFVSVYALIRCSSLFPVIEVASGEYGDLNQVLFEAVQGGLCSEEGKKNSKSDSSCPSQCHSVSDTRPLTQHQTNMSYIYRGQSLTTALTEKKC